MKTRFLILGLALLAVAALAQPVRAQQAPAAPALVTFSQERAPQPAAVPATAAPCPPCTMKVCVPEPKKNTKTVYDVRCKDYCQKSCRQLLRELFTGKCDCEVNCGDVRTKRVLVKKTRPDCDTTQCVVKEVLAPVHPCPPCTTPCPR